MKKSIALFLIFALSVALIAASTVKLLGTQEKVEVREEVLAGSREAAEGLTLRFRSMAGNGKLFFDTRVPLGPGELAPETDFAFESNPEAPPSTRIDLGIHRFALQISGSGGDLLAEAGGGSFAFSRDLYEDGRFWGIVREVAARTQSGTKRTETVRARDYAETFDWYCSGYIYEEGRSWGVSLESTEEDMAKLTRFFEMEIPEDFYLLVTVAKDRAGNAVELSVVAADSAREPVVEPWPSSAPGSIGPDHEAEGSSATKWDFLYAAHIPAVLGEGGIWTFPSIRDGSGREMIRTPEGPGLYFIPLVQKDGLRPDIDRARLVYANSQVPVKLSVNGGNVELVTREGEDLVLTVIDGESGEPLLRETLFEGAGEDPLVLTEGEGLGLYTLWDGRFALTVWAEGRTSLALTGRLDTEVVDMDVLIRGYTGIFWDGRRLAVTEGHYDGRNVLVVDETGVLYYARFDYSPLWDGRVNGVDWGYGSAAPNLLTPMTVELT